MNPQKNKGKEYIAPAWSCFLMETKTPLCASKVQSSAEMECFLTEFEELNW